jgi:hypothetical protein
MNKQPTLPIAVQTPRQVADCLQELELAQQAAASQVLAKRVGGKVPVAAPELSDTTEAVLKSYTSIEQAIVALTELQDKAWVVHITTASDLTPKGRQSVVGWFRENCNPLALATFGIIPEVGGGVVVRTPYHNYDFSYATQLWQQRDKLAEVLKRG